MKRSSSRRSAWVAGFGLVLMWCCLVAGCGLTGPPTATVAEQQRLDVCALLPAELIDRLIPTQGLPERTPPPTAAMLDLGSCHVSAITGSATISATLARVSDDREVLDRYPDQPRPVEVPGGRVFATGGDHCEFWTRSDSGFAVALLYRVDERAEGPDPGCDTTHRLATAVVQRLTADAPMIDWEADSLAMVELCEAIDESGLPGALDVAAPEPRSEDHRQCVGTGSSRYGSLSARLYLSGDVLREAGRTAVADRPASLESTQVTPGCKLTVQLNSGRVSDELRRHAGRGQTTIALELHWSAGTGTGPGRDDDPDPPDCERLRAAAERLVLALPMR